MSQFGQFTQSGGTVSSSNINVGSFVSLNPALVAGLQFRGYSGYFSNAPSYFDTNTETSIGLITNFTNITTATNNTYIAQGSTPVFSVEWYGYFYAPTTGSYTFTIASDDASYVWLGSTAVTGYTTANSFINNGGEHGVVSVSNSTTLTAATYTPIRIQYGDAGGGYDCQLSFSGPGIATTNNFANYFYFPIGGNVSFPANAARLIKAASGTNTDRVYYINVNGTSTPTYCLMNSAWNGGGWMMMMKATRGDTFNFNSTYWTDSGTTLNTGSTDLSDADAKFNIMNYGLVKDVMALWPDVGYTGGSIVSPPISTWTWLVNNYYSSGTVRSTLLTGLSAANSRNVVNDGSGVIPSTSSGTSFEFRGWKSDVWSMQAGIAAHVMGGGSHLPSNVGALSRWGFITNNETDWKSIDVFGGVGLHISWASYLTNYSGGDFLGCCQNTSGLNRSMRVQMFGR